MSKVSVIIPVHNAAQTIAEAASSVLNQSHANLELILVENGSTDDSLLRCQQLDDERIVLKSLTDANVSDARNVGLDNATGEWCAFLDADDTLPISSLSDRLALANRNPQLDAVDGTVVEQVDGVNSREWRPTYTGNPRKELIHQTGSCFYGITWLIRRSSVGAVRFPAGWTNAEDLTFFTRLSEPDFQYGFVSTPIYCVRKKATSASSNLEAWREHLQQFLKDCLDRQWIDNQEYRLIGKRISHQFIKAYIKRGGLKAALTVWRASKK